MFASCVCWVFLIWCQVLNRSAAANEETAADDMNAVRNGTLLPVPSTRPIPPLSTWGNKIKGVAPRVQDAASCYHSHQKTLLEELKDYKVVFPKVLSGKKKRSISTLPQSDHPEHISVSVEIGGEERVLDLSRNDVLLPRGFQVSHYDSNDTLVTEKETEPVRSHVDQRCVWKCNDCASVSMFHFLSSLWFYRTAQCSQSVLYLPHVSILQILAWGPL